jgi:hypothetical protein
MRGITGHLASKRRLNYYKGVPKVVWDEEVVADFVNTFHIIEIITL